MRTATRTAASPYTKLKRGLVAYWPLASAGAVDLEDYRGYNDLTNNNTVTRAAGPSANLPDAADFVAASSQTLTHAGFVHTGNLPFTVWAWVFVASSTVGAQEFITHAGSSGNRGWFFRNNGGQVHFLASADGTAVATATAGAGTVVADTWQLAFGWHDPARGVVAAQVPGGAAGTTAFTGPVFPSSAPLTFGSALTGRVAQAGIVVGRILTDAEKAWLYNNGQGRDFVRGV